MHREREQYGTIVVVGGGCYGSYYVRQLQRAAAAGAVVCERLLVVDRDPDCRVAGEHQSAAHGAAPPVAPEPVVAVQDWHDFFHAYLAEAMSRGSAADVDAIVPSPLMPHLLFDWLIQRARERWPHRCVQRRALERPPSIPWQHAAPDGTHYVSFAEWICPINCIEPARCPEIRGPRTWSMPPALRAYASAERARGHQMDGPVVFQCSHRAYGVGMIDTRDVLAADRLVAAAGAMDATEVLVGTVSHCHGAWGILAVGAPAGRADARDSRGAPATASAR
ncbi:MAG TPA: hypothetical protein VFW98_04445 [Gemmatimonadaceae bacterium]|nr:hypothetical protein [Gemmatimonadaceae bacterium]